MYCRSAQLRLMKLVEIGKCIHYKILMLLLLSEL